MNKGHGWTGHQGEWMSKTIAITGKGGVGKTTIAALIIDQLIRRGCAPVLAVDADPNCCLDSMLGVKVEKSLGTIREESREIAGKGMSSGISKQQLLELKIAECLVEAEQFDLIAMGRPEGPGCYCYANNVLKSAMAEITSCYPWVVLDNEAGLENLSRRIVQKVDVLIMVADPSRRGLDTLVRLSDLARGMGIQYDQSVIIINRVRKSRQPGNLETIKSRIGADRLIMLPDDDDLACLAEDGHALFSLPDSNPVRQNIDGWIKQVLSH